MMAIGWLAVLPMGCTAATPPSNPGDDPFVPSMASPMGSDGGVYVEPDIPTPGETPVDAPAPTVELDPVPVVTHWDTVKLSGRGPAHGTVLVETLSHGAMSNRIDSTGVFCIDVPLGDVHSENEISVRAIDAMGRYSEPVLLDVVREAAPDLPEPVVAEVLNVATNGEPELGMATVIGGQLSAVTDGNPGTFVELRDDGSTDTTSWLMVRLTERSTVDRLVLSTTADHRLLEFKVLLSDEAMPTPPIDGDSGWTEVAHIVATEETASAHHELTFDATVAQYVGIQLLLSEETSWQPCLNTSVFCRGLHQIKELEAWSTPEMVVAPPVEAAPTCSSGH